MIHYLEKNWGVHFVMGGTGALVRGLVKMFEEGGGGLHCNARASERLLSYAPLVEDC